MGNEQPLLGFEQDRPEQTGDVRADRLQETGGLRPPLAKEFGDYAGILLIGDPHLEGRTPGFRKDDYPEVVLEKLQWCLDHAAEHRLLPALLGDLFDKPRDNPNWLLVRLLSMLRSEVIGLYGNHDCAEPELSDNDSLSVLIQSGRLRLVSAEQPWRGTIAGCRVVIGGSSYRQPIPKQFERESSAGDDAPVVIWLTHHDVLVPGYDEGHIRPREVPGIDLVVNGHIHRRLENVAAGGTLWVTPGNISRRKRSDATRLHVPSVLRVDIFPGGYELHDVHVPHRPFEEVFHELIADAPVERGASAFVTGLAELQARRTDSGAGLMEFLEQNISQLDAAVAAEIRTLAMEVTTHGAE